MKQNTSSLVYNSLKIPKYCHRNTITIKQVDINSQILLGNKLEITETGEKIIKAIMQGSERQMELIIYK